MKRYKGVAIVSEN